MLEAFVTALRTEHRRECIFPARGICIENAGGGAVNRFTRLASSEVKFMPQANTTPSYRST